MSGIFGITITILGLLLFGVNCISNEEDTWVEPNAWAREHRSGAEVLVSQEQKNSYFGKTSDVNCFCPTAGDFPNEGAVTLMYYKKLIHTLFSRSKLKYDNVLDVHRRSLVFSIKTSQLDQLERLEDPRDLDSVLTDILGNVRVPYEDEAGRQEVGMSIPVLIWDILKDLGQLLKTSEVQFSLLFLIVICVGYFMNRRYRIGFISMILGGFFLFGYFTSYLECNRELENKQILEMLSYGQETIEEEPRWYNLYGYFSKGDSSPKKPTIHEQLKKSSRLNLGYCRPDHVLIAYANDIFFKQLELILEKCTATIINVRGSLGFPFNFIAPVMLIFMIAYIMKLTFKYILSPGAWASLLTRSQFYGHPHHQQSQPQAPPLTHAHAEDRLSGENLKVLLNAFNISHNKLPTSLDAKITTPLDALPSSGVQEVTERASRISDTPQPLANNSNSTTSNASQANTLPKDEVAGVEQMPPDKNNANKCDTTSGPELSAGQLPTNSLLNLDLDIAEAEKS